jgi:hypothetical protein
MPDKTLSFPFQNVQILLFLRKFLAFEPALICFLMQFYYKIGRYRVAEKVFPLAPRCHPVFVEGRQEAIK